MNSKLSLIPNIIIGIKLKDKPVEFILAHIHIRYSHLDNTSGSFLIGEQSVNDYISNMLKNIILINDADADYTKFGELSNTGQLNCFKYNDDDLDGIVIDHIIAKLENIVEDNLQSLLTDQQININSVTLISE